MMKSLVTAIIFLTNNLIAQSFDFVDQAGINGYIGSICWNPASILWDLALYYTVSSGHNEIEMELSWQ